MDLILFEDNLKYDPWLKFILFFSVVLVIVLGLLFYIDAYSQDIFPGEPEKESKIASIVMFATAVFILLVYWAVLPRKASIFQDKIKIVYGAFSWSIPFYEVESARASKGSPMKNVRGSVTSMRNQIEIVRKEKKNIRISPTMRDRFLDSLNRALEDWRRTHDSANSALS